MTNAMPGLARVDRAFDRALERVGGLARSEVLDDPEERVDRALVAEDPEQGDEHDHPREDREDRVVRQRRGVVGDLQAPVGADDALERRERLAALGMTA